MTVKIITCAALLLAACGGAQPAKEEAKTPETVTEVKHGAEIALLKPDSKAGMTVNEALETAVHGVNTLLRRFRSKSFRASCGPQGASTVLPTAV